MALFTTELKRKLGLFLIGFALAGLSFVIIYPNFTHRHHHCSCKAKFEAEANNIAAAMSNYFAIPNRTQIPTINDLVDSGDYTLLENRDLKHKKLVQESEFFLAILGNDNDEITIVVSSKEGKCPFEKGKCPWSKGEVYVKEIGHSGVWLDSY
jgi:hypothetical protein